MAEIHFDETTRQFPGTDRPAVDALDLHVSDGEFLVLVGPSGCGKTTSLRMLAGLETVDAGAIYIGSRDVTELAPRDRDVAMVFQNYALYPHMSVADNMGFSLKVAGVKTAERRARVQQAAELLDLGDLLHRKPRALSGGQRQRVAMGRAIVRQPKVFLMDEPLSNLDAQLRVQTRAEIHRLQRDLGVTTVYVTHDQVEAMTMGDRVAVMRDGVLQQVDSPQQLYDHPVSQFVAAFIGSPSMNLIETTLLLDGDELYVTLGSQRLVVSAEWRTERPFLTSHVGHRVVLGFRPEDVEDGSLAHQSVQSTRVSAVCEVREALGSDVLMHFTIESPDSSGPVRTRCIGRLSPQTQVREGQRIDLTIDTRKLHFFDLETGLALDRSPGIT